MKKKSKDFEQFQREFEKRQKQFGLLGYRCFFKYEPLEDCFANISIGQDNATATVCLNSKLPKEDMPFRDPKRHAKHEAIHLLTSRLESLAKARYVSRQEIYEAWEELTRKLEVLIP